MSTTRQYQTIDQVDPETIERGMQAGRQLRSQAFVSSLKALFTWRQTDHADDEAVRLSDGAAHA